MPSKWMWIQLVLFIPLRCALVQSLKSIKFKMEKQMRATMHDASTNLSNPPQNQERSVLVSTDANVSNANGTIVTGINSINTLPRYIDFNYRLNVCKKNCSFRSLSASVPRSRGRARGKISMNLFSFGRYLNFHFAFRLFLSAPIDSSPSSMCCILVAVLKFRKMASVHKLPTEYSRP